MGLSCIGFIISVATLNKAARYAAAFFYVSGCFSSNALVFGWSSNSLNQSPEKSACSYAIINIVAQFGNIWSPYFFPSSDGPRYLMAFLLMMSFSVLSATLAMIMKVILIRANRKLKASGNVVSLYTL